MVPPGGQGRSRQFREPDLGSAVTNMGGDIVGVLRFTHPHHHAGMRLRKTPISGSSGSAAKVGSARSIAAQVGIPPVVCTGAEVRERPELAARCSVFAVVLPEDKHLIVRSVQDSGRIVGMTGDGVNDAPAFRQAEVGIAVESAVDVAKVAASMVLTDLGLVDTVAAVGVSRRIYQRMMTWTLNKLIKTAQVALFLTLAFMVTGSFVTTPLLIVLLLLANDFVTMSLAVDHARPGPRPARWQVRPLVAAAVALATVVLAESFLDL